jgi:hypothetical protein
MLTYADVSCKDVPVTASELTEKQNEKKSKKLFGRLCVGVPVLDVRVRLAVALSFWGCLVLFAYTVV